MATSPRDVTDYMGFQDLLSDEERMVREQARQFVNAEILPIIEARAGADLPAPPRPADGRARVLRPDAPGPVRLRGPVERRGGAPHVRARARRLRHPLLRVGAGVARDVPDLRVRERRAEGPLAPAARPGRGDRLLRPDR